MAEGWRRLHNEELHNLYTSQNFMRWAEHVADRTRNAYKILIRKPEGKLEWIL